MAEQTPMVRLSDEPVGSVHAEEYRGTAPSPAPADSINIYRLVSQSLRGRYVLSAILGIVCAAMAVAVVWTFVKPIYRSEAIIRIAYDAPSFNSATANEVKPIEAFDAFMQSQQALIGSQRVMDMAATDPAWAEIGIKPTPAIMEWLAKDLRISRSGGAEHILVGLDSKSAKFSAAGVQAVVNAYTRLYTSTDTRASREKIASLEARRESVQEEADRLEQKIRTASAEFGSSNIEKFHEAAVQRLTKVESELIDVRIALALASAPPRQGGPLSPQQIARFDQTMARYIAEREARESEVEQLRLRGYGEGHKQLIQAEKALQTLVGRIQEYALEFQNVSISSQFAAPPVMNGQGAAALIGRSPEELKSAEVKLTELDNDVKKQLQVLGDKKAEVDAIKAQVAKQEAELTEIAQKLSVAQLEASLTGRMSVVSPAEVPVLPVRDRRPQMLAGGLLGGFFLPAAGFVAVGFLRRRYRYSDDASSDLAGQVPLLGILPLLPHRLNDPDSAADAAQCVHQIRVMLQVNQKAEGPVSYMVTSSCPGEGKTSLVTSLAMSFAISGAKTLLVDADLIGQRLTRGFGAEKEQGFRDVLAGRGEDVSVVPTRTTNLSLLPCGVSDGRDACAVSSVAVKRLLSGCRKDYDVILVDSGPILGSLEASVVAGQVDGVILTISREQQKPLVDRAVAHLRSVGAQVAGMVFNKAERRDFYRSVSASSLRSISTKGQETSALVKVGVTATSGFGSLVDSVQSYMPTSN